MVVKVLESKLKGREVEILCKALLLQKTHREKIAHIFVIAHLNSFLQGARRKACN